MKYILSNSAMCDIEDIKSWGSDNFGKKSAIAYLIELRQKIDLIARNPFLFQSVEHIRQGYRRAPFKAHSIYYKIEGELVIIKRIIGKQSF